MGSMSGLIADEERETRENRRIDRQRHKDECLRQLTELIVRPIRTELYLPNDSSTIVLDYSMAMEAASDIIKENSQLKREVEGYRNTFKMLHYSILKNK